MEAFKQNPFPGMNPFMEQQWEDAHARLIGYMSDGIQEQLPEDLVARAEERVVGIGDPIGSTEFRSDVSVVEPWKDHRDDRGGGVATMPPPVTVRAPGAEEPSFTVRLEEFHRWIEIRDLKGKVVTVIELLSPSNEVGAIGRERYQRKRQSFLSNGINMVEIDLIRQGAPVFDDEWSRLMGENAKPYGIYVSRMNHPQCREGEADVYLVGLRQTLPVISVPLRSGEPEIALALQPLIDQCHVRGRYHLLHYDRQLYPRLVEDDLTWVNGRLLEHGLS